MQIDFVSKMQIHFVFEHSISSHKIPFFGVNLYLSRFLIVDITDFPLFQNMGKIWEKHGKNMGNLKIRGFFDMQSANYHGKITKRKLEKCKDICRTWCELQYQYAEILNNSDSVDNFQVNIPILDSLTSDFLILYKNGSYKVFECIERKNLSKPSYISKLQSSLNYWSEKGIDWGIITNAEK